MNKSRYCLGPQKIDAKSFNGYCPSHRSLVYLINLKTEEVKTSFIAKTVARPDDFYS